MLFLMGLWGVARVPPGKTHMILVGFLHPFYLVPSLEMCCWGRLWVLLGQSGELSAALGSVWECSGGLLGDCFVDFIGPRRSSKRKSATYSKMIYLIQVLLCF